MYRLFFFHIEQCPGDGSEELCILNPDKPLEINYSDPACPHFELSDSAAKERKKLPANCECRIN